MQGNPHPKQGDTRLALDKPLRSIGDSGRSSALISSAWRAGVLAIDAVPAVRRGDSNQRVRADCCRAGSAAAMIVCGAYQKPAIAPRRGESVNRARGAAIAGLSPASLATHHGRSEGGAP